jgi:hypothetical protein
LGAGPLGGPGELLPGLPDRGQSNAAVGSFESDFVDKTSGELLRGTLKDRAVAILSVEGADDEQVKEVRAALKRAGADITATRTLTEKLVDPANRQFAEGVARQSAGDVAKDGADSYQRIGAALARALIKKDKGALDGTAQTIWSAFEQGELVTGEPPSTYADCVVLIVGGERSDSASTVIAGIARALDAAAQGSVVAGPSSSSLAGGAVARVRSDAGASSTVDVLDSAAGSMVVALALQQDADGKRGAWGTPRSRDGAVPAE